MSTRLESMQLPSSADAPGSVSSAAVTAVSEPLVLALRPFLAITCLFWLYACLSAVLYAYGMSASLAAVTDKFIYAPWAARVLQYLFLLPALLLCYWWSLRLGWRPVWQRLWPQLGLAIAFAIAARPALWAGLELVVGPEMEATDKDAGRHVWDWLSDELLLWVPSFTDFLVRYGFGLALVTGFAMYKRYRDAEVHVTALEQQWTAARLAALRMQLSPHTLFNLLHTIRGQIAWDPPAAQTMVVQLADLLRRLLNAGERDFTRLSDELQFVGLYLDLQRRRFPDRLTLDLPDAECLPPAWVPSLILQPLVENAVAHGLAGHAGPVRVALSAKAARDRLSLTVSNNIASAAQAGAPGVGLRNVQERLAVQFGERAKVSAGPVDGRWVAEISMPLLAEPPAPAGPRA